MKTKLIKQPLFILLIALASALIIGYLGLLLPEGFTQGALEYVISPLQELFLRFLTCIAGPMIFLCVALGITGVGDVTTLGKIGRKMVVSFFGIAFILSSVTAALAVFFFKLPFVQSSDSGSQWKAIMDMLVNFVPKNIVSPFSEGNTLQIIILGLFLGIAMLLLGQKVGAVNDFLEQFNLIIQKLMAGINKFMYLYVFLALVKMIWSKALSGFTDIWKLPALFLCITVVATLAIYTATGIKLKVNPFRLMRICLPQFLIALSTASSTAAFDTALKVCEKKLGIHHSIAKFGVPLTMIMFKAAGVVYLTTVAFYFASAYGLNVSLIWIVQTVLMTVALNFAIPPVPGGGLNNYTVLFLQLGIPSSALALALAADSMMEFIITGFNVFTQSPELLALSKSVGMVDEEILKKR